MEAKLSRTAVLQGRDPHEVVQEALARYFDDESRLAGAMKLGEDALRRGDYLTHEQVGQRLERFLRS